MSGGTVTGDARKRNGSLASMRTFDCFDNFLVTLPACLFRHFTAVRPHLNVVFKPAGGEVKGMPETIPSFGAVFPKESGRCMTIVANGGGPVRRLKPAIILFL